MTCVVGAKFCLDIRGNLVKSGPLTILFVILTWNVNDVLGRVVGHDRVGLIAMIPTIYGSVRRSFFLTIFIEIFVVVVVFYWEIMDNNFN